MIEMAVAFWMAMTPAVIDPPPPQYDHLYPHVRYVYDYPKYVYWDDDTWAWAWEYVEPGKTCTIHLSPVGSRIYQQIMTEETYRLQWRHAMAHCNGWRH